MQSPCPPLRGCATPGHTVPPGCPPPPAAPGWGLSGNHQQNEFASAQQLVPHESADPQTPPLKPKSDPQKEGTTGRPCSCWPL